MNSDTPLPNVEELCIRYVMNELDASESAKVEKLMLEDPDILIEIESLRATKRRLSTLPVIEPPDHVVQSVLNMAQRETKQDMRTVLLRVNTPMVRRYAAAALVLFTLSIAGYFLKDVSISPVVLPNQANAGTSESIQTQLPWVDTNDVIQIGSQGTQLDTVALKNARKLRLLQEPLTGTSSVRSVQLTRTQ